jgi:hypothetical protein
MKDYKEGTNRESRARYMAASYRNRRSTHKTRGINKRCAHYCTDPNTHAAPNKNRNWAQFKNVMASKRAPQAWSACERVEMHSLIGIARAGLSTRAHSGRHPDEDGDSGMSCMSFKQRAATGRRRRSRTGAGEPISECGIAGRGSWSDTEAVDDGFGVALSEASDQTVSSGPST